MLIASPILKLWLKTTAFVNALTKVCAEISSDLVPILTVIVVELTALILIEYVGYVG